MPSSPVGSNAYDYAEMPSVGIAPPSPQIVPVSAPDSEPIKTSSRGPAWSHSSGGGSSGKDAPVPAQVRQFS